MNDDMFGAGSLVVRLCVVLVGLVVLFMFGRNYLATGTEISMVTFAYLFAGVVVVIIFGLLIGGRVLQDHLHKRF